ncbi:MAG TPA: sodium:solute symporter [Pirellulales bacterium]|nr:sodium:solute symporter [Pirellulales bacterium]
MAEPLPDVGLGVLAALAVVIGVSAWLGAMAQRVVDRGSFLQGYFLGNRGLGVWTMALTTTVQSGGTFMGFPSLVYSHGWIVTLWIASYMLVPLTGFTILGKRFAQLSRRSDALTVPDLFRSRFDHPAVGLVMSLLIMFFLSFMMVAQFKAGAIVMKLALPHAVSEPGALVLAEDAAGPVSLLGRGYYIGLAVFSITVVGYTLAGGFLASVWTDLFQSVLMLVGVLILLALAVPAAGGLEHATREAIRQTGPGFACGPGYSPDGGQFLPLGLAVSMFFVWIFGGVAAPASMVRVMACSDTAALRRSIVVLGGYNLLIYFPLIAICIAARVLIPNLPPSHSDEIVPRMALLTTSHLPGGPLWAGLILAAPFGAVMATVSAYLVVIASGVVHDVYQRFVNPVASEVQLRRLTYLVMIVIGAVAVTANLDPVQYLQAIVVFCTSSRAAAFLVPALMAAYWRRGTAAGAIAAMIGGSATMLVLSALGWWQPTLAAHGWLPPPAAIGPTTSFRPYLLLGLEPVVWGLAVSLILGAGVSLATRPPREEVLAKLFD